MMVNNTSQFETREEKNFQELLYTIRAYDLSWEEKAQILKALEEIEPREKSDEAIDIKKRIAHVLRNTKDSE
jgi:hypothetical protein